MKHLQKWLLVTFAILVPLLFLVHIAFLVEANPRLVSLGVYTQVILLAPLILNLNIDLRGREHEGVFTAIMLVFFWGLPLFVALTYMVRLGSDLEVVEYLLAEEFVLRLVGSQLGILALVSVMLVIAFWGYWPRK